MCLCGGDFFGMQRHFHTQMLIFAFVFQCAMCLLCTSFLFFEIDSFFSKNGYHVVTHPTAFYAVFFLEHQRCAV